MTLESSMRPGHNNLSQESKINTHDISPEVKDRAEVISDVLHQIIDMAMTPPHPLPIPRGVGKIDDYNKAKLYTPTRHMFGKNIRVGRFGDAILVQSILRSHRSKVPDTFDSLMIPTGSEDPREPEYYRRILGTDDLQDPVSDEEADRKPRQYEEHLVGVDAMAAVGHVAFDLCRIEAFVEAQKAGRWDRTFWDTQLADAYDPKRSV
jgi:hypothetical protein